MRPAILSVLLLFVVSIAVPISDHASAQYGAEQNRELVTEIQELLTELGYDPGAADGILGARTSAAIRAFRADQETKKSISVQSLKLRILFSRLPSEDAPSLADRPSALAQRTSDSPALEVAQTECPKLATATAPSPQEIARVVFPSVVLLVMEDRHGQALSQGSGFLVAPGVIATNLHVVEGAASGAAKFLGSEAVHEILGIVGLDERRDLVLLAFQDARRSSLCLGSASRMEVGERVYAVGNPMGLEGTFSEGIVSGVRHVGGDTVIQITAPISPGSSGGPVLNDQGQVIGVATATFEGGQNLNFVIPSSYLATLVSNAKPVRPLSAATKRSAGKSVTNVLGGKGVEGVTISHFKWKGISYPCFTYSIRNLLRRPVRNVTAIAVFYDEQHIPVHAEEIEYRGDIRARLAKRFQACVPRGVRDIAKTRVEFRILGFEFAGAG